MNIDRLPPHSIEIEQMILGGILLDEYMYSNIAGLLLETYFYRNEHQIIFKHIMQLKSHRRNVDALTLAESLKNANEIDFVGGYEYINKLVDAAVVNIDIVGYAEIVKDYYVLRQLIATSGEIAELALATAGKDVDTILDEAEQKIFSIKNINANNKQFANLSELFEIVGARILTMAQSTTKSRITGVATHFTELDYYTSGLQKGELIIIAGRPGMGKTALALNIAENIALSAEPLPSVIFSLEMTAEQLAVRLLSSHAQISQTAIKRGEITRSQFDKLQESIETIRDAPIYIAETPGINVIDIRARVRRIKNQLGTIGAVIIDYVQIMSSIRENRTSNRAQEIADISRSLKALAIELGIPIILLSQLNREVEGRQDKRPNIADLRESGALEQDADIILLLFRESYYNQDMADNKTSEVHIAKNRSGSTGVVKLTFKNEWTKFINM